MRRCLPLLQPRDERRLLAPHEAAQHIDRLSTSPQVRQSRESELRLGQRRPRRFQFQAIVPSNRASLHLVGSKFSEQAQVVERLEQRHLPISRSAISAPSRFLRSSARLAPSRTDVLILLQQPPDKRRPSWARISTVSVDEIADQLYALRPEEFTAARNQAERELRKVGEREQADEIKALRKPNAAAGAVNRLVHEHRAEVEAFLEAAARLRDAEVAGLGDLAAATRAQREALEKLVALGSESVRRTLQAAAVDDDVAADVLQGRLVQEAEPAGFGTLLAHVDPSSVKTPAAKQAATRRGKAKAREPSTSGARPARGAASAQADASEARARLQEAKRMLEAAQAEERQAERRWADTHREVAQAAAAVEKAQRELDSLGG